jgi:acetyl esterase
MSRAMDLPEVGVGRVEDRRVPGAGREIPVRIYWPQPAASAAPLPILLLFHGGGFALGDIETHDHMARFYCSRAGVIVINVDYRRSPENKFPAGVEDCYTTLEWAAAQAATLGVIRPGSRSPVKRRRQSAPSCASKPAIARVAHRAGPVFAHGLSGQPLSVQEGHGTESISVPGGHRLIVDMYFRTRHARHHPLASRSARPRRLPAALVITAGFDPPVDEGRLYAERLAAAGVPVEYRCFDSTIHGFMSFAGALDVGREGLDLVAARLRSHLGHGAEERSPA